MIANTQGSEWAQALQCWRTVVAATEATSDPVVCSTRIPVFLSLRRGPYRESRNVLRQSLKFARRFLRPLRPIPALRGRADVLFGINSPSPATVGNLSPVIAEADRRGVPFAVLTINSVKAGEHFCANGCGTVTEDDLLASVPASHSLPCAIRRQAALCAPKAGFGTVRQHLQRTAQRLGGRAHFGLGSSCDFRRDYPRVIGQLEAIFCFEHR